MLRLKIFASFLIFFMFVSISNSYPMPPDKRVRRTIGALREEVREMFRYSYGQYMEHAFPMDELEPLSCRGKNTWGSYALTLLDSLDSLLVFGEYEEFERQVKWVISHITFNYDKNISVFETNIRVMGALLSAHTLITSDVVPGLHIPWYKDELLHLAKDLGNRLSVAFLTPTRIPYGTVNLVHGIPPQESQITCTSGATTFSLEFGLLSKLTGNGTFEQIAKQAVISLWDKRSSLNLVGNHINIFTGKWTHVDSGIGHGIDSFFEYLAKSAFFFNDHDYWRIFQSAYESAEKHLKKGNWYIEAEVNAGHVTWPLFNSLQAFWPGMQVLFGDLPSAISTTRAFHTIWREYGVTPEKVDLVKGRPLSGGQSGYPLRPELAESVYYLSRTSPDSPEWLYAAEDIVDGLNEYCKVSCGFAAVANMDSVGADGRYPLANSMDSFFLAETLKYLYLTFDIDNWANKANVIFNTEAHIFPFHRSYLSEESLLFSDSVNVCPSLSLPSFDPFFRVHSFNDAPEYWQCWKFLQVQESPQAASAPAPPSSPLPSPSDQGGSDASSSSPSSSSSSPPASSSSFSSSSSSSGSASSSFSPSSSGSQAPIHLPASAAFSSSSPTPTTLPRNFVCKQGQCSFSWEVGGSTPSSVQEEKREVSHAQESGDNKQLNEEKAAEHQPLTSATQTAPPAAQSIVQDPPSISLSSHSLKDSTFPPNIWNQLFGDKLDSGIIVFDLANEGDSLPFKSDRVDFAEFERFREFSRAQKAEQTSETQSSPNNDAQDFVDFSRFLKFKREYEEYELFKLYQLYKRWEQGQVGQ